MTKLFVIAFLFQCMSMSLLLAWNGNAQVKTLDEVNITLSAENTTVTRLFREIEEKTGFNFVYTNQELRGLKAVSIHSDGKSLYEVLKQIGIQADLGFKQVDGNIHVKRQPKAPAEVIQTTERAEIRGLVRDAQGEPIPGATVFVEGTNVGTATDIDGRFALEAGEGNVLVISFIGYKTFRQTITSQSNYEIVLEEDQSSLDEVVVVGYGTQKRINLTGAVDVVSGERLANRAANNVADLLQGTTPNLNISMNMRGGEPGSASTWNLRGIGSLAGNASPLILVDGVEMNIQNVDPESIESISVLKDASASAIYGARAPFGVILITTKKGGQNEKVSIQYSNNFSMNSPIRVPSFVDSYTWATAYNQANANAGLNPVYSDEQMNRIRGYIDGTFPYEYDPENPIDNIWAGRRNGNANWDWPRVLLRDYSLNQKHNLSVSGGNEKNQYFISGGYIHQNGMYEWGNDHYKRYNFMTNFTSQVTPWLAVNTSVKYADGETDYPIGQTTVDREHFFREILMFAPMMPFYNINGTVQSPLVRLLQGTGRNVTNVNDFFLTLGGELEPVKGWKTRVSYNYNNQGSRNTRNPRPVWVELGTGGFGNVGKPNTGYSAVFSQNIYQLVNVVSTYEKAYGGHYLQGTVGYEQEYRFFTGLSASGTNLISTEVPSISTSIGDRIVSDDIYHWATQGVFGRFNYNYEEKYLVEFSARYNGSSRFDRDSRWGFFPSASAGYNLSQERFWDELRPHVGLLKLRASYGSLGNQNVANYLYLPTIPVSPEASWIIDGTRPPVAATPSLVNDELTWETITTLNAGLDVAMISNRLNLTFDWYNRTTSNMLGPSVVLPYTLGATTPRANNAKLSTKGFELGVKWEEILSPKFSYHAGVNLGDSKSEILEYLNENGLIDTWYAGKQVGEIWGLTSAGLMQSDGEEMPDQSRYFPRWGAGDMKYVDLNGDGFVNDGERTLDNHGDLSVIGNTLPRYNVAVTGGFRWRQLDFSMFWQGIGQRDYFPHISSSNFWGMTSAWAGSGLYRNSYTLDYWRPENESNILGPNTDGFLPKPYFTNETNKNRQVQTAYLLNAAYLRLKNLQIGFTLPPHMLNALKLTNARIYLSGENLLTITSLPRTLDPETMVASDPSEGGYMTAGVIYPIHRSFSAGINVSF